MLLFAWVVMPLVSAIVMIGWIGQILSDPDRYDGTDPPVVLLDFVSYVVVQAFALVMGIVGAIGVGKSKYTTLQVGLAVLLLWTVLESLLVLLFAMARLEWYTSNLELVLSALDLLRLGGSVLCFWWLTVRIGERRGAER